MTTESYHLGEHPKTEFVCVSGLCPLKFYPPPPYLLADIPKKCRRKVYFQSKTVSGDHFRGALFFYDDGGCVVV